MGFATAQPILRAIAKLVMPGLVPGIHVLAFPQSKKDVDGRDKPGHDESDSFSVRRRG
jgi:hypothetical protein